MAMLDVSAFPARFTLRGVLLNVFERPSGKDKEGRAYGGDFCAQLMSCDHLKNGESKVVPTDVSIGDKADADALRAKVKPGEIAELPVSVYVNGARQLVVQLSRAKAVGHAAK